MTHQRKLTHLHLLDLGNLSKPQQAQQLAKANAFQGLPEKRLPYPFAVYTGGRKHV